MTEPRTQVATASSFPWGSVSQTFFWLYIIAISHYKQWFSKAKSRRKPHSPRGGTWESVLLLAITLYPYRFSSPREVSYALKSFSLVSHLCSHLFFLGPHWCLYQGWLVAVGAPRAINLKESMVLYSSESALVKVLLSLHAVGTLHLYRTLTPGLPSTSVYVPLLTTAVVRSYSSDPAWVVRTWLIINTQERHHAPSWFPPFSPET